MAASFPPWVSTTEKQSLYGQAEALGASLAVLSSENSTQTFVNTKLSTGILFIIIFYLCILSAC
jgi:hypothetical protein